ncbi:MAG: fatty acid-binding protein DegV [Odoribacter sp.]|nr:fatty acid-binding protein DegV [Odoribacter sp.]
MANTPLIEMDGRNLYYTFIAGARKVIANQTELNKINVFPVSDGDTGTNLASTIRSVIESLQPHRSYKITADRIAESTLMNARGNSGIIFAQFFYGLSNETSDIKSINLKQFAESIQRSVKYIYEAVANPVEGTMLTVIKEWADYIYMSWHKYADFDQLLLSSYAVLKKSLAETKTKLEILARANVVDAGAKGFVLFVEGIIEYIHTRNFKELIQSKTESIALPKTEEVISENVDFRYCTEAIIKNTTISQQDMMALLGKFGDSGVVAGSDKMRRIHVHTNNPADLFYYLRDFGTITFQKADDMIRQSESVFKRKYKIALVTDSTCDLAEEFLDRYQIHMLPVNISFGDNHYLDKITLKPDKFYKMLVESPDYPKSSQINEKSFMNLYSHLASHYDSVIAVNLSDKLSGTFHTSQKAAQIVSREFNKPIDVINSRGISGSIGLLVLRIAEAIEKGFSHDQIVKMAEKWVKDTSIYVTVTTLKYLIRGGRLSYTKGLIARLLHVSPIISIDENGKVIVFDKAFTRKANMEKIMGYIRKQMNDRPIWNYMVLHANNPEAAEWYKTKMESLTGKKAVSVLNISPIIGANVGVGASAVAFMNE